MKLSDIKFEVFTSEPGLDTLYKRIKNNELATIRYEGEKEWGINMQSELIESFYCGLPIPPIYVYQSKRLGIKYEVIDGRERIRTIRKFFDNELRLNLPDFGDSTHDLNNKKYSDLLENSEKLLLDNAALRIYYIESDKDITDHLRKIYQWQ